MPRATEPAIGHQLSDDTSRNISMGSITRDNFCQLDDGFVPAIIAGRLLVICQPGWPEQAISSMTFGLKLAAANGANLILSSPPSLKHHVSSAVR